MQQTAVDKKTFVPTNILVTLMVIGWGLSWFPMKFTLPALPTLAIVFQVNDSALKLSITLFFFFFALSQMMWGIFAQYHPPKRLGIFGFIILLAGTLIVIFSHNIEIYILGRCIEGIGAGSISPLYRTVSGELFSEVVIVRVIGLAAFICGLVPAIIPIIAGYILVWWGWRFIFIVFLLISVFYFLAYLKIFPIVVPKSRFVSLRHVVLDYAKVLANKRLYAYLMPYVLTYGLMLGYYAAMPYWYVQQWHIATDHYAFLAIFSVASFLIGLMLARYSVLRVTPEKMYRYVLLFALLVCLVSWLLPFVSDTSVYQIVTLISVFTFISGLCSPLANALILKTAAAFPGLASSIVPTFLFFMTGIFSWIESHLLVHSILPIVILASIVYGVSFLFHLLATD